MHACVFCTNAGNVVCVCMHRYAAHICRHVCIHMCVICECRYSLCVHMCIHVLCIHLCVHRCAVCACMLYMCYMHVLCICMFICVCTIFFFKMAVLWWRPLLLETTVLGTNTWVKLPYICPRRLAGGCAQIHSTPKWGEACGTNEH